MNNDNLKLKKVLVLLDAHAILHRSFHALPSFTSPEGEPTGAVYGFCLMLLKIIHELKPDYLGACYDLPEPTFRHIAYKEYKIKRPKMAEELVGQIEKSRQILKTFRIPIFEFPGFEADDILSTVIENLKSQIPNLKIIVASGDLDILQLVKNDDVVVYMPGKGVKETIIYNEDKVKERFGFSPCLLPDFKGLVGDPSDNIIGVPGIGEKTAKELIQKFGSLEEIYQKLKEDEAVFPENGFGPRIIKLLKENEEKAMFSKALAKVRRDVPISFSLEETAWKDGFDFEEAKCVFEKLGFKSLISRLPLIQS